MRGRDRGRSRTEPAGDVAVLPSADGLAREDHVFTGWSDDENVHEALKLAGIALLLRTMFLRCADVSSRPCAPNKKSTAVDWEIRRGRLGSLPR